MIRRFMYRAECRNKNIAKLSAFVEDILPEIQRFIDSKKIHTISLYRWMKNLFIYYECVDCEITPGEIFGSMEGILVNWPGEQYRRSWVPMVDVFHFNEPTSMEYWSRKQPIEKRIGKVARLRPEKVASYIYYHYQLQEEQAFHGEKYKYISMHENLLFMYDETPPTMEPPMHKGKLNTTGTPKKWEDARMDLHFIPWDESRRFFREMDTVFSL